MTLEATETPQPSSTDQPQQTGPIPSALTTQKNCPPKACKQGCLYDGKANARHKSYVYCSLCYHSFHNDCVSLTDEPTSWTCPSCRLLPADVNQLKDLVSALVSKNAALTETVTRLESLLKPLTTIENKITAVHSKLFPDDDEDDDDDDDVEAQPTGTLLIGDSLVRDVIPTDDTLTVESIGGAHINTIHKKLRTINPRRQKYETITVVVGTNDASSKRPPEKICVDYKNLITVAQSLASNVVISSIPPREDARVEPGKIDTINLLLLPILNEADVTFVNNDTNFRYRDNSIDSSLLLADKLHLSAVGVNKLLLNLGLSGKAKARQGSRPYIRPQSTKLFNSQQPPIPSLMDVRTSAPPQQLPPARERPVLFHGARSPLSNFFPCNLNIWNMHFRSSEHAYQYKKCIETNNNSAASNVLRTETAVEAKRIGDEIGTSQEWQGIQQAIMKEILKAKSQQCP